MNNICCFCGKPFASYRNAWEHEEIHIKKGDDRK